MSAQPSFNQYLTAWKYAVVGKPAGSWPQEIEAGTVEEFQSWQNQLAQCKVDANNKGITCQFNKGGTPSSGKYAAWVIANEKAFKVVFNAKAKRPQAMRQTSLDAYHSIDFTTQRDKIAEIIRQYSEGITRKEIEVLHRFGCNVVAGRVKELLEMSEAKPFLLCGKPFRLQVVGTRLSNCEGASNVPNEVLRWVEAGQSSLFQ